MEFDNDISMISDLTGFISKQGTHPNVFSKFTITAMEANKLSTTFNIPASFKQ